MTPKQIDLVQQSWAKVQDMDVAALFYRRLFERDPSLRALFKADMTEQGRRLTHMIDLAVSCLSSFDRIVPTVQAMGRRHAGYGVTEAHYAAVAGALLWTLEQGLGADFSGETRDAWIAAYAAIAGTMQSHAHVSDQTARRAA